MYAQRAYKNYSERLAAVVILVSMPIWMVLVVGSSRYDDDDVAPAKIRVGRYVLIP